MKAVICTKYGSPDVLKLSEMEKPVQKDNEILIRIFATSVTAGDVRVRNFDVPPLMWIPARLMLGIRGPKNKILGNDFAGEVEAIGKNVTKFKVGDQVFGALPAMTSGTYAEYVSLPERAMLVLKPSSMTYTEVASIPFMGLAALVFLRDRAKIQSGQKVLIYGASGAVGTFAVQLAKCFGAEVTGVCSTKNLDLVKSLGADKVIDYTQDQIAKGDIKYDIIFDAVGKISKAHGKKILASSGVYVTVNTLTAVKPGIEDLQFLKELLEKRKIKAVIDKIYPLDQIIEAHRYVETGRKRGNVIVTV